MLLLLLVFLAVPLAADPNATVRHCGSDCRQVAANTIMEQVMPEKKAFFDKLMRDMEENDIQYSEIGASGCVDGKSANEFPCHGLDLVHFLPYSRMGSSRSIGNDIWGWTDPETGREYALSGQHSQTAIVDITGGHMKTLVTIPRARSTWSDIKVYKNHMYVGTEGGRGIQVFDLTQLRGMDGKSGIQVLQPDSVYVESISQSHNVVINEDTGFMYVVGSRRTCRGGLHIVNIQNPSAPVFEGCYSGDGYTHDAECVVYHGPDERYKDREICFAYNEDTLTIVDVEDKANIKLISKTSYYGRQYTHQGWCTEDHEYLLLDDELDEQRGRDKRTKTLLWDIRDLENPKHFADHYSPIKAIDHNLYTKGNLVFESNYGAGLRVLDVSDIANGKVKEIAYFDVHPERERGVEFVGAWSVYPYFKSGYIPVNSIERGLFLLKMK